MRTFASMEEVLAAAGEKLGETDWHVVDQRRIDLFAEATGDHQWIHVDAERAATGPFGGIIAHGYLTLSLIPAMMPEVVAYDFEPVRVNYGLERVRFLTPVRVGARLKDVVAIGDVTPVESGARVVFSHEIRIEGEERPACIAQTVSLLLLR